MGAYKVRVENQGFKTHVLENVILTAGGTTRVDMSLEVGATQQTIEVTANAQLLQVDTARMATEMSSSLVDQLPVVVNGGVRSPFDLAAGAAEEGAGSLGPWAEMARAAKRTSPDAYPGLEDLISVMERVKAEFDSGDYGAAERDSEYLEKNGYC